MTYDEWYQSGTMVVHGREYRIPPNYPMPAIRYKARFYVGAIDIASYKLKGRWIDRWFSVVNGTFISRTNNN